MNLADELEKLNNLRQSGALSEQEFEEAKAALLARAEPVGDKFRKTANGISADDNMWGMLIHLSQFCGYLLPFAGLVVPIILWVIKKDESAVLDRHGRIVINWIITECILSVVFGFLSMVLIGIPLLIALGAVSIIFPIIGAVKANGGEVWTYPCSFRFLSVPSDAFSKELNRNRDGYY